MTLDDEADWALAPIWTAFGIEKIFDPAETRALDRQRYSGSLQSVWQNTNILTTLCGTNSSRWNLHS